MKRYFVYLAVALLAFIISLGAVSFVNEVVSFLRDEYSSTPQEEYHCSQ